MVDVTTTLTFELTHVPDKEGLRVVVGLPDASSHLRDFLSMELGARWPHDDQHFEIELKYARTAAHHLKKTDVVDLDIRPVEGRIALAAVVNEAIQLATQREDWAVSAVEILGEEVTYVIDSKFEGLELRGTYVVRVTQTR